LAVVVSIVAAASLGRRRAGQPADRSVPPRRPPSPVFRMITLLAIDRLALLVLLTCGAGGHCGAGCLALL